MAKNKKRKQASELLEKGVEVTNKVSLRRTAREIKIYRSLMRIVPIAITCSVLVLITGFVISAMYNKYGSFTVMVDKLENVKYALTLSESPKFKDITTNLNSKASENITNIRGDSIPQNVDMINGEHNGENYVAYTFYCKNMGEKAVNYEYKLFMANCTNGIENAVRVKLYVDGKANTYAYPATDGSGAEPGTVMFETKNDIVREEIVNFKPGDITKFTVVIWLEGDDPECVDNILGGVFKVDMKIKITGVTDDPDVIL